MRIFLVTKKLVEIVLEDVVNFVVRSIVGVSARGRAVGVAARRTARIGVGASLTAPRIVRRNVAGVRARGLGRGTSRQEATVGIDAADRATGSPTRTNVPGLEVVQVETFLVALRRGVVTQEAFLGRSDWANVGNARVQDGAVATLASSLLGERAGTLAWTMDNFVGKDSLAIERVRFGLFFASSARPLVGDRNLSAFVEVDGFTGSIEIVNGNATAQAYSHLTDPLIVDATDAIEGGWTWEALNGIRAYLTGRWSAAAGVSMQADSFLVEVTARRVDTN